MVELDGFGKPCPLPLMLVKKALDEGSTEVGIRVDNETAVANITRMLGQKGLGYDVVEIEGGWFISTSADGVVSEAVTPAVATVCGPQGCGYSVFVGKDHVGEGDPELGYNLMKMAIYTLSEADVVPASLLFMNSGVKLVCGDESQIIESVQAMQEKGTKVLVCGTCLNFYGIADDLKVGTVSNMYDILGRMHEAGKVISL